jgi:hypothetical protein
MNIPLVGEVYQGLRTSRDWYDRKREGIGDEFADLFFDVVNGLSHGAIHRLIDEIGNRCP